MEFKFINPFSEEFLKEKELDDNIKRQNLQDNNVFIHLSYKRMKLLEKTSEELDFTTSEWNDFKI